MEKTAMQQLIDHVENMPWSEIKTKTHIELLTSVQNKAKELLKDEKQQLIDFHLATMSEGLISEGEREWEECYVPILCKTAEKVFNKTFGGKIKP